MTPADRAALAALAEGKNRLTLTGVTVRSLLADVARLETNIDELRRGVDGWTEHARVYANNAADYHAKHDALAATLGQVRALCEDIRRLEGGRAGSYATGAIKTVNKVLALLDSAPTMETPT